MADKVLRFNWLNKVGAK